MDTNRSSDSSMIIHAAHVPVPEDKKPTGDTGEKHMGDTEEKPTGDTRETFYR